MINELNQIDQEMKITQAFLPTLKGGAYKLHATGTIVTGEKDKLNQIFDTETVFRVDAPRFALAEGAVYSCYPTDTGDYSKTLPNIVFNGKTLPWERSFGTTDNYTPWMALLLLDEDEIKEANMEVATMPLKELINPTANILLPNLALSISEKDEKDGAVTKDTPRYAVIDIPCPLLGEIIPYENELSLLAHARQVDTKDKEAPQVETNGWYSVIVGNRLPTHGKKNTAFLVALEGHEANINPDFLGTPANGTKKVRFIALGSWQFDCEGEDFETIVRNIEKNTEPLCIIDDTHQITDKSIETAFSYGYTALNHEFRNGAKSVSWYRGPLAPVRIDRPDFRNYTDADAAMRLDKDTAMFDVSYSSAWQLGRILAIQEAGFMNTLQNWKKNVENKVKSSVAQRLASQKFSGTFSFPDMVLKGEMLSAEDNAKVQFNDAANTTERDEFVNGLMAELWTKHLKPNN